MASKRGLLNKEPKLKRSGALLTAGLCVLVGVAVVVAIFAAGTPIAFEAEVGTVAGSAVKLAVTGASGAQGVKFAAAATPTPTVTATPTPPAGGFQANCIVTPHACGYPDATNTGVPAGTTLTNSGSITVSTNGAIIQNLRIAGGTITVKANNVTIKNTLISGCSYYPIDYDNGTYSGLVVQDTEIASDCSSTTSGMSFGGYTALRMNVHGTADGFKANSNTVIQDSYFHDLWVTPTTHNDGVQSTGGSNVTLKHNTCDMRGGGDTCIQFGANDSGWAVSNNLFSGGNTTIWVLNGGSGTVNSSFTNNRFTRKFTGGPASFGSSGITWTGNYYDDNGAVANK